MTSNIGSEHLLEGNNKETQEAVSLELKDHFKPEFLNRIDEIIFFNSLDNKVIKKIAMKFIAELEERLSRQQITLEVTTNALDRIADYGFDRIYGARPLKRYIQKEIETPLARKIIETKIHEKSHVIVDFENGSFVFKV